jgi:two-component system nitrate/nitrite response regulator NarL
MSRPIALLIVDDVLFHRQALAIELGRSGCFAPITLAGNAAEALWRVKTSTPAVTLVKWDLPGNIAPDLARQVVNDRPDAKVLLLGVPENPLFVAEGPRGACAIYVPRQASLEELVAVIEQVHNGKIVGQPWVAGPPSPRSPLVNVRVDGGLELARTALTRREQQIVELIAAGLANKQIAAWLHLSLHTVKNHVHNILEKLDLPDRHAAARSFHASHLSSS